MGETEQEVLQLEVDEQKSESPDTTEEPEGTAAGHFSRRLSRIPETVIAERDDFRDRFNVFKQTLKFPSP